MHVDNLSRQFTTMSVNSQTNYVFNTVRTCNTYFGLVNIVIRGGRALHTPPAHPRLPGLIYPS